jgi:hypothetical protein
VLFCFVSFCSIEKEKEKEKEKEIVREKENEKEKETEMVKEYTLDVVVSSLRDETAFGMFLNLSFILEWNRRER